ncbi:MAG: hypothetical protein A2275_08650 [Bacteroidetes bacterium RIFOXYA12_FULL_35_11]|nr:MAG: hypothetical protein A2X01_16030 [Bacteroidetes bacterium GWF2_35_48]OFY72962.1 MAG: hypothetical protein A2275_08650 [Bacteroidetes bacterium RIFOXYA12_FULL_35_11]OFY94397.1 MAG: hypothetical protein A2309_03955 [Bacteroidetes bacterium RIFOXYB2_FULL_35_7]HBX50836.1 hypothetical protein [Bacteroidales bacterium]
MVIVISGVYFSWVSFYNQRKILFTQIEKQLFLAVDFLEHDIHSFFGNLENSVRTLTANKHVQEWAYENDTDDCDTSTCPLNNLYQIHKNEVDAILLMNKSGNILERFPKYEGNNLNKSSCCQNKCVLYDKNDTIYSKVPEISNIFINKQGHKCISVSCNVFYKSVYYGTVRWIVKISTFSKLLFEPVEIGERGDLFILDSSNIILFHSDKKWNNIKLDSLNDTLDNNVRSNILELLNKIKTGEKGHFSLIDFSTNQASEFFYKKIYVGAQPWIIVLRVPEEEMTSPIKMNTLTILFHAFLLILFILLLGFKLYTSQKKKIKLEYEKNYLMQVADTSKQIQIERDKRLGAIMEGQEKERHRISKEIHDGLGQLVLATKLKIDAYSKSIESEQKILMESISKEMENIIDEIHVISHDLVPSMLYDIGLEPSLRNLIKGISQHTIININFTSYKYNEELSIDEKLSVYRIVQEALNNIVNHSVAHEANIQILKNPDFVTLIIQDDGIGFDVENKNKIGKGLSNIYERATALHANIEIKSQTGKGTTITMKIPI